MTLLFRAVLVGAQVLVAACATPAPSGLSRTPVDVRIDAGKHSEMCTTLGTGQRVHWRFESTAAVDFNVHTHRGREVITPVDLKRVTSNEGSHATDTRGDYCLMWENRGGVPAFVRGEWRLTER